MTAASPAPKRRREGTFEDRFTDVEIDDTQLDEEDLKQLDCIESPQKISPQKLPNGNLKCNHACKDKTKYHHSMQQFLIFTDAGICAVRMARSIRKPKPRFPSQKGRRAVVPTNLRQVRSIRGKRMFLTNLIYEHLAQLGLT